MKILYEFTDRRPEMWWKPQADPSLAEELLLEKLSAG